MSERGSFGELETGNTFLQQTPLSLEVTQVAQLAVRAGARDLLEVHEYSPEQLQVSYKLDYADTAVTVADLRSSKTVTDIIKQHFPDHTIIEEESGYTSGNDIKWYVDPLDGTASYARKQRYSTVCIAIYQQGKPLASAICSPYEQELFLAEKDKGAYSFHLDQSLNIVGNPIPLRVSDNSALLKGQAYIDGFFNAKVSSQKLQFMQKLIDFSQGHLGVRMTGSNVDQQTHVARGKAELTLTDTVGGFYDIAAGGLLIEEAGGKFTDMEGKPIHETTVLALGSNGQFHDQLLAFLQELYQGFKGFK